MKLEIFNKVNTIKLNNNVSTKQINFKAKNLAPIVDTFERSTASIAQTALNKLKNIDLKEYKLLTEVEKIALRNSIKIASKTVSIAHDLIKDLELHQYTSECIKQALNREFGEGNYVIITLGRSLSSIGKLLSFDIGEKNVKNIPLSNLSNVETEKNGPIEHFNKIGNIGDYQKFLTTMGLSRKEIEASNKNYIIIDYAYSGNSIKNAYKILTSDVLLGNKKRNITFSTIQDFLPQENLSKKNAEVLGALIFGKFKAYSYVDRLHTLDKNALKKATNPELFLDSEEKKYLNKLFGFALLDSYYGKNIRGNYTIKPNNTATYPHQKKQNWLSKEKQFNKDVFIDLYELDKAILKTKDIKTKEDLKTLRWKLKLATPTIYYSKLKSMINKILEK